jgi:uncharacterized protein (UPF0261 family)
VLIVATMDTKGEEALYLKSCLKEEAIRVLIMDAGILGKSLHRVNIRREEVARAGGSSLSEVQAMGHEGEALEIMTSGAVQCALGLFQAGSIGGIIGLGGSMGTSLGTAVMRAFPIGFPKVMISTMASRNTRPFVGTKDILMLHSVCDLSGINRITEKILQNGALAIAGMVKGARLKRSQRKPLVALSTLGTTEQCAVRVRQNLEATGNEVIVFHTVGSGGEALEEMVREGEVNALVDLSLHELADHLFGGDYDAGPERGKAALREKIPTVLVPGNIDFLVTGPVHLARQHFPGRKYHVHNAAITVVRTETQEVVELAKFLAALCRDATGPLVILVPLGGFSAFDRKGGPLHDPEAPTLFSDTLRKELRGDISLHSLPYHINDEEFALAVIRNLAKITSSIRC